MNVRSKSRFGLSPEALESRVVLAGDVAVHVVDGNLMVEGDAEGNRIAIASGDLPGVVFVAGIANDMGDVTTINGQEGRVRFEGVVRGVRIGMGDGDDAVHILHLGVRGDVVARLGAGNDRLAIGAPMSPNPDPNQPPLGLRTGGSLIVESGDGDDAVRLDRVLAREAIRVMAGAGDDAVSVAHVKARFLGIASGDGNDNVRVVDTAVVELAVELGAGDDRLEIGNATAQHGARLNGGLGEDTIANLGGNRFRRLAIIGFEHREPVTPPSRSV